MYTLSITEYTLQTNGTHRIHSLINVKFDTYDGAITALNALSAGYLFFSVLEYVILDINGEEKYSRTIAPNYE